jgi:UDP-N-acetylglucosamine 2-epimerase (non-hydrolysing)
LKIATILGTRPEIIRLSAVIRKLDKNVDHVLVHTGQNFDYNLSDLFFSELGVRAPDTHFGAQATSFGGQIGQILEKSEEFFRTEKPDRLLLLGDTNSALSAIVSKRLGIPVFHMEAGNRCYDDRVPEEVNRRIIDHSSDVLLPYTEHSRKNLLREGIAGNRIYVTGNPIAEVIADHQKTIDASGILRELTLAPQGYFLVTLHRAENVDLPERLAAFGASFNRLAEIYNLPVIVSTHPRTRSRLDKLPDFKALDLVRFVEPFGFSDFVALEQQAFCVLSDSGTVQEECSLFKVPNVTLRDVTERPETVDCGSNYISGADFDSILRGVKITTENPPRWTPPQSYQVDNVSDVVLRIVTSYFHGLGKA